MVATLRGKLAEWTLLLDKGYNALPDTRINRDIQEDVLSVLINLGHRIPDAKQKIELALEAITDPKDTQELLREIFRLDRGINN